MFNSGRSSSVPTHRSTAAQLHLRRSLRLYWAWGLLILAVIWGLVWQLDQTSYKEANHKIREDTQYLSGIYEAQMIRALGEIDRTLALVTYSLAQHPSKDVIPVLDEQGLLPTPIIFQISLVNSAGVVLSSNQSRRLTGTIDTSDFAPMASPQWPATAVWVAPSHPRGDASPRIRFVRRVQKPPQGPSGFVIVAVEPSYLVSAYDENQMGHRATIGLLTRDGHILAARTGDKVFSNQHYPALRPLMAQQATNNLLPATWGPSPWDDVSRFTSFRRIDTFKDSLYVTVAIERDEHLDDYIDIRDNRFLIASTLSAALILGLLGALRLTTRARLREYAVRQIEQTYHAASEASPDASFVLTAVLDESQAVSDFVILDANQKGAALLGLSLDGIRNIQLRDLLSSSQWALALPVLREVFASGTHYASEGRSPFPKTTATWLAVEIVRVPRGLVIVASDITSRKTAEDTILRSNAALKALNQQLTETQAQLQHSERLASIGLLAAGVAHEINNPVGFVTSNFSTLGGYVRHLFDMLDAYQTAEGALPATTSGELRSKRGALEIDYLKDDIPALLQETKDGLERVKKIVADLKDFSRPDSDDDWQTVDLHGGIESTLNVLRNEIKYTADVVTSFGDIPLVECLPGKINQVIMNLVVNAAHAMTAGRRGCITIRTRAEGDEVRLEVQDDGSGMAPDTISKIFDPFFTTKPVGKGTGLGLSLSYGIIQNHSGRIEVESELGRGTTFIIHLPVRQAALSAAS